MITVRKVEADDWQALKQLRLEALQDTPDAFGSTYAESVTWPDQRWKTMAADWNYYFAESDGQVVGMLSGSLHDHHPGTWWMFGMYVKPAFRGQGAAEALVERVGLWAKAQGACELYLHVTESVGRARAFYEKNGFVLNGERIIMDRDPSISLVTMVKHLD